MCQIPGGGGIVLVEVAARRCPSYHMCDQLIAAATSFGPLPGGGRRDVQADAGGGVACRCYLSFITLAPKCSKLSFFDLKF